MYQIEDSSLRLSVFEQEGQALAELTDLQTGIVWGPTPVLPFRSCPFFCKEQK